jgi:hypothetical protein
MEDEELPSESTSRPIFRQNVQKTLSSTNANTPSGSSSKFNKKVKLTSTTTKKSIVKPIKQSVSRKKNPGLRSTPKAKRSTALIDNFSSTDDDMYGDNDQRTVQKSDLNNSSTHQINNHIEENVVDLNRSFASDRTDNNDSNQQSDVVVKTTSQTKEDVWSYFTRQINGDFKCNLCTNFPKVIYLLSLIDLTVIFSTKETYYFFIYSVSFNVY